jgi:hypothetical protein
MLPSVVPLPPRRARTLFARIAATVLLLALDLLPCFGERLVTFNGLTPREVEVGRVGAAPARSKSKSSNPGQDWRKWRREPKQCCRIRFKKGI